MTVTVASLASGCLARSLAIDTQPILVVWSFGEGGTFGCEAGREDLPVMKIRTHVQPSGSEDDEFFDWVPCRVDEDFVDLPVFHGLTTPLELNAYDVEVEMWTADRTRRIAVQTQPHTAVLNEPAVPYRVDVELRLDPAYVRLTAVPDEPDRP